MNHVECPSRPVPAPTIPIVAWRRMALLLVAAMATVVAACGSEGGASGSTTDESAPTTRAVAGAEDSSDGSTPDDSEGTSGVPAGMWIAVASGFTPEGTLTGAIHTSSDGVTWTKAQNAPPLEGVAEHDGVAVAVGTQISADGTSSSGVVVVSEDGSTWSSPIEVPDELTGVTFAFGRWIAVGNTAASPDSFESDGVVYESADARTWTRSATIPGEADDYSGLRLGDISSDGTTALVGGSWCAGDSCVYEQFRSSDGTTWDRQPDRGLAGAVTAFGGAGWGMVASSGNDLAGYGSVAGISADGQGWELSPTDSSNVVLNALASTPDGWAGADQGVLMGDATTGIWSSTDLVVWARTSEVADAVSGLVVAGTAG
jgi:hypothetical protein